MRPDEIKDRFTKILKKVVGGNNIERAEAEWCLIQLLDHNLGIANDVCFGAFLAALQTKNPTPQEVAGLMDAVMNHDRMPVEIRRLFSGPICGIIGSGKDDFKTFNVSSISSIVASSLGARVVKNGSRSEASVAGTTDVFEMLGLDVLNNNAAKLERSINVLGFGFCDAEPYFPKMAKEYLGKYYFVHPLSFILPVASGLSFERVVFGLASDDTEYTADLLIELGYDNSMVVAGHSQDGKNFDEISNIGPTKITEIKNGIKNTYWIIPEDWGVKAAEASLIAEGSSVEENARIFKEIISGNDKSQRRDVVLMNASALLYIAGIAISYQEGISMAREALDSGKVQQHFNDIIEVLGTCK